MLAIMACPRFNTQIARAVVGFIAVNVMNNFIILERTTKHVFCYDTVLSPPLIISPYL